MKSERKLFKKTDTQYFKHYMKKSKIKDYKSIRKIYMVFSANLFGQKDFTQGKEELNFKMKKC